MIPRRTGAAGPSEPTAKLERGDGARPIVNELGGVVVDKLPIASRGPFITSPSIAMAEDGTYLASHDYFFRGEDVAIHETKVFRSTDKGRSWDLVSTIDDFANATLFTSGRYAYMLGRNHESIITRRSSDMGDSWGSAHVIRHVIAGGLTPNSPVIHDGRIWFACFGRAAISASLESSVLDPAAWASTNRVDDAGEWFPGGLKTEKGEPGEWTEAQVVASPQTGVVVLPKTRNHPYTALIQVTDPETATFDPRTGLRCLPGGEKKFACVYDPASERFYALTNPVLPAHADSGWEPNMVRNTGAIFSSRDLRDWSVEGVFLYSPDVDHEAFQYFAFAIDGDDLAVVARTALAVDGQSPPRGHDANLLTFHVVENFRGFKRDQVLVADTNNNRVVRFEANLTTRLAPLGTFSRSTAMRKPMGIAQGADGDFYVSEQIPEGRVLRFNYRGQLRAVLATGGADFTGTPESLIVGADGRLYMTVAFGSHSNKVYKIDTQTKQVTLFVASSFSSPAGGGTLEEPRGIAIGPRRHLDVADRANEGIREFDRPSGEFLGNLTGDQVRPEALALYVADRANDRIREFDPVTGEFLGNLAEGQRRPQALSWDPPGRRLLFSRWTTDSDNGIAYVAFTGEIGTLCTGTDLGRALGIQSVRGRVYWTDYDNDRIYVLTTDGAETKATSVSTGLNDPGNMARVVLRPSGELSGPCARIHTGHAPEPE